MTKRRYVMVGGFLGAGKTTLLGWLAHRWTEKGIRVGLITNDQSRGLVDSVLLRRTGLPVEEIAGGCFCCRFDSLEEAVKRLNDENRPDVFLAEPVGSCTDLLATVSYPLRRIWGGRFTVAPLTVVVDPIRAARILGLESGRSFSSKVVYVYRKQLEEARTLLVNKTDTVEPRRIGRLVDRLRAEYPGAEVRAVSALRGTGLAEWSERVLESGEETGETLDIDYDAYARGEALLGWLNRTVRVRSRTPFDANDWLFGLARCVQDGLAEGGAELAHLKLTLDAGLEGGDLAAVSLVGSDRSVDVRETVLDRVRGGSLVVNLRAEAPPRLLEAVLDRALAANPFGLSVSIEHTEVLVPKAPVPLHREVPARCP